jgi:hypothetical protein
MRHITTIVVLVAGLAFGCTRPTSRSIGSSATPKGGTHRVYAASGILLQRTDWRHGKLVAAWQYEQQWELPLDLIAAVHRDERDYPPPRWIQTVANGKGRIHTFDEKGAVIGFEDYFAGEFWKGAH